MRDSAIPEHLLIPKDASPAWLQAHYDPLNERDMTVLMEWSKNCSRINANVQVSALLAAGWTFELPGDGDYEPWQWYWRAPPKRKGKPGRKYLSTNQAYRAMMRENHEPGQDNAHRGQAAGRD